MIPPIPACAIFLVTGDDRASHDIFRRYRSAFEELGGGFHHLVIFGQHGVSSTQRAFLGEVALDQASVPLLVIAPMTGEPGTVYTMELQKGDRNGDLDESQQWGHALESVIAVASGNGVLSLAGIEGIAAGTLRDGALANTVEMVLAQLGGDG